MNSKQKAEKGRLPIMHKNWGKEKRRGAGGGGGRKNKPAGMHTCQHLEIRNQDIFTILAERALKA